MAWIQPIYWRTASDVANKTAIGLVNAIDMIRVNNNTAYLAEQLAITLSPTPKTNWIKGDLLHVQNWTNMYNNLRQVIEAARVQVPAENAEFFYNVPVPNPSWNSWQVWNEVERLQWRVYRALMGASPFYVYMPEMWLDELMEVL